MTDLIEKSTAVAMLFSGCSEPFRCNFVFLKKELKFTIFIFFKKDYLFEN